MKHAPLKYVLPLITCSLLGQSAAAGGLSLPAGASRVLGFNGPAATFHIADPGVLDARAVDDSHVELIARAPGSTLVAAYDAKGRLIYSGRIRVGGVAHAATSHGDSGTVLYQRGTSQIVYQCHADRCQARSQTPAPQSGTPATAAPVMPTNTMPTTGIATSLPATSAAALSAQR